MAFYSKKITRFYLISILNVHGETERGGDRKRKRKGENRGGGRDLNLVLRILVTIDLPMVRYECLGNGI